MNQILQILGGAFLIKTLLGAAATNIMDKITYGFESIRKESITLFDTSLKARMVITNQNPVAATVHEFVGILSFGAVTANINLDQMFVLAPEKITVASFLIKIENDQFFDQLADQISTGGIPSVNIRGQLTGEVAGKIFTLPVDQNVQVI